jgi:hypothetical protein
MDSGVLGVHGVTGLYVCDELTSTETVFTSPNLPLVYEIAGSG